MFYVTISENFERFQYFNFEPDFLENKSFSKNWSIVVLDENIYIKNASFPYKTVISEANPKTNKIMSTKWTCYKERSFTSNYFICFKICTNNLNVHIRTFCKRWSFLDLVLWPFFILVSILIIFQAKDYWQEWYMQFLMLS